MSNPSRFKALDGLRGLAILTVVLNHVPVGPLFSQAPSVVQPILKLVFVSGWIGVDMLFIMTGFLMGWLYAQPMGMISFWSRRLLRLLPPFLVMVVSLTVIKLLEPIPLGSEVGIVLGIAILGHGIWKGLARLNQRWSLQIPLTLGWMGLQVGVAVWYAGFLMQVSPSAFFQTWDERLRIVLTGLVNATLTFPFGQYLDQLDGVYWTLALELAFYLSFPIILVPLWQALRGRTSVWLKWLLLLSLFPFGYGLYLVSGRILWLGMLNLHLGVYFIAGLMIATRLEWLRLHVGKWPGWVILGLSGLPLALVLWGNDYIPSSWQPWVQMLLVLPIGLLFIASFEPGWRWGRWLEQPILRLVGKYGYAMYLTHALVINLIARWLMPTTVGLTLMGLGLSLIGTLLLAKVLYELLEKPYQQMRSSASQPSSEAIDSRYFLKIPWILVMLSVILFGSVWLAFRVPTAVFSVAVANQPTSILSLLKTPSNPVIRDQPIQVDFVGRYPQLGLVMSHIRKTELSGIQYPGEPAKLWIRLYSQNRELIAETAYKLSEVTDSRFHPFGFAIQTQSQSQRYTVEYQLKPYDPSKQVELVTDEEENVGVYQITKSDLRHDPHLILTWLSQKLLQPTTNPQFWIGVVLLSPLLGLLWVGINKKAARP